jgi:Uma2 family endonuclease
VPDLLDPTATLDADDIRETWDVADESPDSSEIAPESREPVDEDRKGYELIYGTWVEKPEMGAISVRVGGRLVTHLTNYAETRSLGDVLPADGAYQLFPNQPKLIRKPDVSFVATGRLPNNSLPAGNLKLAPDLAVEVVSPNDEAVALEQKLDEYLRAGVKLVWVIHPQTKVAYVYRPDGTAARKTVAESLDGEAVLPGFAFTLSDLFKGIC